MNTNRNSLKDLRRTAVNETMSSIKALAAKGVSTEVLTVMTKELVELGLQSDLFPVEEFSGIRHKLPGSAFLFKIYEDPDGGVALYVNSVWDSLKSPVHNHMTWAIIAGIKGVEKNFFYTTENDAEPRQVGTKIVEPGNGVSLLGDGLHSISIEGEFPVINLHLYGRAMENQLQRRQYDASNNTWVSYAPQVSIIDAR